MVYVLYIINKFFYLFFILKDTYTFCQIDTYLVLYSSCTCTMYYINAIFTRLLGIMKIAICYDRDTIMSKCSAYHLHGSLVVYNACLVLSTNVSIFPRNRLYGPSNGLIQPAGVNRPVIMNICLSMNVREHFCIASLSHQILADLPLLFSATEHYPALFPAFSIRYMD